MQLRRPILQGGDWQDRRKEVGYRVYRVGLDQQEHPRGLPQCVRNTKNTCTIVILDVCESDFDNNFAKGCTDSIHKQKNMETDGSIHEQLQFNGKNLETADSIHDQQK